jgi:hypothetical protein
MALFIIHDIEVRTLSENIKYENKTIYMKKLNLLSFFKM